MNLCVQGRVQGVGFRWFVFNEARRIGVGGFVRNLPDGSVEVEAEGAEEALAALEAACRQGPRSSRVEEVERHLTPVSGASYTGFEIK